MKISAENFNRHYKYLGVLFFTMLYTKFIEQTKIPSKKTLLAMIFIPLLLETYQLIDIIKAFLNISKSYYLGTLIVKLITSKFNINISKKTLLNLFLSFFFIKVFIY